MKRRDVIGKRIVEVVQVRWHNKHLGRMTTTIERITLDDGSQMIPVACETEHEPAATIYYVKPQARK